MPANIQQQTEKLYKTWQENSGEISSADDSSYLMIDKGIDEIKAEIIAEISALH
jgi:hypothetical protein